MNRKIFKLIKLQRIGKGSYRLSHSDHHKPFNPGPPITLDYMPIPNQSFKNTYEKLNRKFNYYLLFCKFFI